MKSLHSPNHSPDALIRSRFAFRPASGNPEKQFFAKFPVDSSHRTTFAGWKTRLKQPWSSVVSGNS